MTIEIINHAGETESIVRPSHARQENGISEAREREESLELLSSVAYRRRHNMFLRWCTVIHTYPSIIQRNRRKRRGVFILLVFGELIHLFNF